MHARSKRIIRFAALVTLVAAAVMPPRAEAGSVRRVRCHTDDQRTRIVLDLDRPIAYKVASYGNPDRIAINIPNTKAGTTLRSLNLDQSVVKRVRVNKLSWGVQVVVDLWSPASYQHFTLAKKGRKSDRIVLDVFANGPAPGMPQGSARESARGATSSRSAQHRTVIAIDPGHGGKDPGTTKNGLVEKKLVLDIARRMRDKINAVDGYYAFLTRDSDRYLTLPRRVDIARSKKADVFVSVHLNSAPNRSARGAEVFFVSPAGARASASKVLANPHQAADDLGLQGKASSELLHMLVDVNQQSVLMRSSELAEELLGALGRRALPPTRGMKQKSFAVLKNISMPSVMVEAGFLSNRKDAAIVKSAKGRDVIAQALSEGVFSFFRTHPPQRGGKPSVVVHKVRSGETLWKISKKYGTSIASLRKVNKLGRSAVLRVGQQLLVSRGY